MICEKRIIGQYEWRKYVLLTAIGCGGIREDDKEWQTNGTNKSEFKKLRIPMDISYIGQGVKRINIMGRIVPWDEKLDKMN